MPPFPILVLSFKAVLKLAQDACLGNKGLLLLLARQKQSIAYTMLI